MMISCIIKVGYVVIQLSLEQIIIVIYHLISHHISYVSHSLPYKYSARMLNNIIQEKMQQSKKREPKSYVYILSVYHSVYHSIRIPLHPYTTPSVYHSIRIPLRPPHIQQLTSVGTVYPRDPDTSLFFFAFNSCLSIS